MTQLGGPPTARNVRINERYIVAAMPEPATLMLLGVVGALLSIGRWLVRRRFVSPYPKQPIHESNCLPGVLETDLRNTLACWGFARDQPSDLRHDRTEKSLQIRQKRRDNARGAPRRVARADVF